MPNVIGARSAWPSRFRGLGIFEALVRAATYPFTHHTLSVAAFLAFLAVRRTGRIVVPAAAAPRTLLVEDLNYWFVAWLTLTVWFVLIAPLLDGFQLLRNEAVRLYRVVHDNLVWVWINQHLLLLRAAYVVLALFLAFLTAYAYSTDTMFARATDSGGSGGRGSARLL
jgi:hypothetical protein